MSESRKISNETSIDSNSNEGKGYENSFDTSSITSHSSRENDAMSDNHCIFDNMGHPAIQSQGKSIRNINISGSLCIVRSGESLNNASSLKKSRTGENFPSNNSTTKKSRLSLSASSFSSMDNY